MRSLTQPPAQRPRARRERWSASAAAAGPREAATAPPPFRADPATVAPPPPAAAVRWATLGALPGERPRSKAAAAGQSKAQPRQQPQPPASAPPSRRSRPSAAVFDLDDDEADDGFSVAGAAGHDPNRGWEVVETLEGSSEAPRRALPAEMRCFDGAKIFVSSGCGGNGATSFRREACVPQGGPDGGCGGAGGSVWVVGDAGMTSLLPFRKQLHFRAAKGGNGEGANCSGRGGGDVTVPVPLGTLVRDADTGALLVEVLQPGQRALLVRGGRGGRGNASFKSNRTRAPLLSEKGEAGTEAWLALELRLVADVGIVGAPNAGKSSLLGALSAATPRVAPYAFTTLVPNLGVCEMDYTTTVFADVPGLVEGAALGVGLGHQFLKHCARCRVLVHLLDGAEAERAEAAEAAAGAGDSPLPGESAGAAALLALHAATRAELQAFGNGLADTPQVVVLNKLDLPAARRAAPALAAALATQGFGRLLLASAATGEGVTDVVRAARALLAAQPQPHGQAGAAAASESAAPPPPALRGAAAAAAATPAVPSGRDGPISAFTVSRERGEKGASVFVVQGGALERFAQMTSWEFFESVSRFSSVLKKAGVWAALKAAGVAEGDTVVIGGLEMDWAEQDDPGQLYESWRKSGVAGPPRGARHWPHSVV